ncbi:MAG: hypothetical protein LBB26_01490 [Puniceicoccales bacterium]|nr:hypothetical protein [Puniceicoccales bacterium]
MNNTTVAANAANIFDGDWEPRMSPTRTGTWLQTGSPTFMEVSRALWTGQPAANCKKPFRKNHQ